MKSSFFSIALFVVFFIFSCSKDSSNDFDNTDQESPEFNTKLNNYKRATTTIKTLFIRVVNEDNSPINNAIVETGGQKNNTNSKGVLKLINIDGNENFLSVKAFKKGYISTVKTIAPSSIDHQYINITLLKPDYSKNISSDKETIITLNSGVELTLSGGYITSDETSYSGNVRVNVKHLSTESPSIYDNMPGSLIAQNQNGDIKLLETYGMLGVTLFDSNGDPLNINESNKAKISFPINPEQAFSAPSTIPLWYFNTEKGVWIQEGKANKEGNKYVGYVNHFSWWNFDVPMDLINFCLSIVNSEDKILPNQTIEVIRKSTGQTIFKGLTDLNGKSCGAIPKGEKVTIKVINQDIECLTDNVLFEADYGNYSSNVANINIKVPTNKTTINYLISGQVLNCNGQRNISHLELTHRSKTHHIPTSVKGNFTYNLIGCEGDEMFITAYDITNKQSTNTLELNFIDNTADLGNLTTCENYTDKTYTGNVELRSQSQIDEFSALGYTKIIGNLSILGYSNSDVSSLEGLHDLTTIEGYVTLNINPNYFQQPIPNLNGLHNLTSITKDLNLNGVYEDLEGLESLEYIGGDFTISGNIQSLNGLNNLREIDALNIKRSALTNLHGIESLEKIGTGSREWGSIIIENNFSLLSLEGLENITGLNWILKIDSNPKLQDLKGLENLTYVEQGIGIYENETLKNLNGLNKLAKIGYRGSAINKTGGLHIKSNPALNDLTHLENLSYIGGSLEIENNDALLNLKGLNNIDIIILNLNIIDNENLTNFKGLSNITKVRGEVLIDNNASLTNFTGFDKLSTINGAVSISNNANLKNFEGLEKLTVINDKIEIKNNASLLDFSGLNNLSKITEDFEIYENTSLLNFKGLEKLNTVEGNLSINTNQKLKNLLGLDALELIEKNMGIWNNTSLEDLEGLFKLKEVNDGITIGNNDGLISLQGLNGLQFVKNSLSISNNTNLTSLDGLESLIGIKKDYSSFYSGKLSISNNSKLNDFCSLLTNFSRTGEYYVADNLYNPPSSFLNRDVPCKQ